MRTTGRERVERIRKNRVALEEQRALFPVPQKDVVGVNTASQKDAASSKSRSPVSGEVIVAFVGVWVICSLYIAVAYGIVRGLHALGLGGLFIPVIFIDFFLWRSFTRQTRYSRYVPFIWWL